MDVLRRVGDESFRLPGQSMREMAAGYQTGLQVDAPSVDGLRRGSHSEREILLEDQRAATLREKRDGIRIMKFWMNQTRYTCLTVFLRKSSLSRGIRMKKNRLWKDFVTRKRKRWKLFRFISSEGKERRENAATRLMLSAVNSTSIEFRSPPFRRCSVPVTLPQFIYNLINLASKYGNSKGHSLFSK